MAGDLRVFYYNTFLPKEWGEGMVSRQFWNKAINLDGWELVTTPPFSPEKLQHTNGRKKPKNGLRHGRFRIKKLVPGSIWQSLRDLRSPISRWPFAPYLYARNMTRLVQQTIQEQGSFDVFLLHLSQADLETLARLCSSTNAPIVLRAPGPLAYQADHVFNRYISKRDRQNEKFLYRRAEAILVISSDMKRMFIEDGIDAAKIHVVPNGVDFTIFTQEKVDGTAVRQQFDLCERKVVGYVGGFWSGNDLATLLRAWQIVEKREPQATLLLVGSGPQYSSAQQLSSELGLKQCVWSGRVNHDQVPDYLAAMDVGVGPYTGETVTFVSPLKVIEYAVMGLPVIATEGGQISELIEDGVSGITSPPGDAGELAEGILTLLANPTAAREMGRLARARMQDWFSWEKMARDVQSVCKEVVN